MLPAFRLRSPETGTDYWLYVRTPAASAGADPWRVVLLMDGDDQFEAAVSAYDDVWNAGAVPPLLLVGVGYGASYTKPDNRRGRDYTPVPHGDEPTSGGGDAFLRFLTTTLWLELGRRYPIDHANRGVAGHSLGSLLVLHALFQPRPFFTNHLASAPSIWWSERAILGQAQRLRQQQSALRARLFLSVGEDDTASMTGDLGLLERQLAAKPFAELDVQLKRFPQRDHYNVLRDAFAAGFRSLYGI